ncbi:MAG TPA: hypothetical protein PLT68_00625 [Actinomycetota bacterium]|nr:hypothetical protein [Actinomycetota bacterium]
MRSVAVACAAVVVAAGIAGCSSGGSAESSPSPTPTPEPTSIADIQGKTWSVDTAGWWVPDDPTGCGTETTTCRINAWPTRAYEGHSIPGPVQHGDEVTVLCYAPTPAAIRNALAIDSKNWVYTEFEGKDYWFADIYITKDNLDGLIEGVPACPSDTPGING